MTVRSPREINDELRQLWARFEAGSTGVRWDDWTDDHRAAWNRRVVVQGMSYGLNGCRLSLAGEQFLAEADDLATLVDEVLARIAAAGDPVASGFVVDQLNQLAAERAGERPLS